MKKMIGLFIVAAALFLTPQNSRAAELLTNGGFETGTFAGWTVNSTQTTNYCTNWIITTAGLFNCLFPSTPIQGTYSALNGFDGSGGQFTMYQDVTIPTMVSARLRFSFRPMWSIPTATNLPRTFEVQIRDTSNNLLENLYTFTANSGLTNQDAGWITQQFWITQYVGQTVRIYIVATIPQTFTGPGGLEVDDVRLETFFPTSAQVGVSGMVTNANGYGIGNAFVSFTDSAGERRVVRTNQFGHFAFENVDAGNTYVFEVSHKRYQFPDSPRVINVEEGIEKLIFTAAPEFLQKRE